MRCNTPIILVSPKGFITKLPASDHFTNGNQYNRKPIKNIIRNLLKILLSTSFAVLSGHFLLTKEIEVPTANRNEGNTKSVGVKPCQGA